MNVLTLPARIARRVAHDRAMQELHRDFARIMAGGRLPGNHGGKRIGIATFGHGEWHLVIELLLAHALGRRGASPELLVCDLPHLPICSERLINSSDQQHCGGCIDVKRGLLTMAGLPWRGMSEFVASSSLARAMERAASIDAEAIDDYTERGFPIGRWLHVSACHFLRCDARGDAEEKVQVRRRLLATAIAGVEAVERWLDDTHPEVVLVQGGAHVLWRITRELAAARGIPVISRELGKGGWDRHIYALKGDCMSPDLDEAWSAARDRVLTAAEEAEVDGLADNLAADTYLPVTNVQPVSTVQIDRGKRIAVAFTNVTWDLATADRDVAFTGVFDWLTETKRELERHPGVHLIVRAHPAEASVLTRERILDRIAAEWPESPGSISVIAPENPITARELIEAADLVLAYNSTAGLEAAMHGTPVVLCGSPHFRGRGFTMDVDSREAYRDTLRQWATGRSLAHTVNRDRARRYFHLFFARYHIPMGWTTSPLEPPYRLLIDSAAALEPGVNPSLDLVCEGILHGRQILRATNAAALRQAQGKDACAP